MNLSNIQKIVAIMIGIITIAGAAFGVDRYVAKQADMTKVEMTLVKDGVFSYRGE